MLFVSTMFLVALTIAGVAAFFSITGLVAIFSASAVAVIIMGTALEIGKLVAISYTYRYWNLIGWIQKMCMLFFVVLLMVITSIGIFGFLSKAHLEKIGPQDQYVLQIDRLEGKIASENKKIQRNQSVLDNLDQALDKYIELGYVTRGLEQREEQSDQREQIESAIKVSESKIDTYNDKKNELESKMQEIELEVGPIKYVAQLIYGDSAQGIEMAVKLLIIMLVCTFDPLAVALLIGANHAHMNRGDSRVRSEFSILEEGDGEKTSSETIQNKDLGYDDLTDEQKAEQKNKVKEYLKTLDDDDTEEEVELHTHKYQRIVPEKQHVEEPTTETKDYVKTETSSSPYTLNKVDAKENDGSNKQQKGNRYSWLPRRNPPKE